MKELSRQIVEYSRLGLILLVLSVLVSAVGGSVEQLAADLDSTSGVTTCRSEGESMSAVEADPAAETACPAGNMNRGSHSRLPLHPQHLTPVILPLPDKTENRIRQAPIQPSTETPRPILTVRLERTQTSPCLIDSHLGQRLTLVGARPSGTS